MYAIVFCGYEGLDNILWAGDNREEAVTKIKEARNKIGRLSKIHAKYDSWNDKEDIDDQSWRRYYDILDKWPEPWRNVMTMGNDNDINRVCVMESQGEWGFKCVCKELDVSPEKPWYY